jgi:5-oxoprolinase (ATP-hydrolysing)
MGESVRRCIARTAAARCGRATWCVLNDPYNGGTHLPDVTVITPVFDDARASEILLLSSARAGHHADIGGITPGSTPPALAAGWRRRACVIDNFLLVAQRRIREAEFRALLASARRIPPATPDGTWPTCEAQVAANEKGVQELHRVVAQYGLADRARLHDAMCMDNAEESVRKVLDRIGDGAFDYAMDDGTPLKVQITVDKATRSAKVDFTGTGPQRDRNNFNSPPAVTRAAVLYVFRCLVGSRDPAERRLPQADRASSSRPAPSSRPHPGAAVVAGNTEVSQATCNALFGALGTLACSQATMNNFLFGDATPAVLRDHLRRHGRRPGTGTARRQCRRT